MDRSGRRAIRYCSVPDAATGELIRERPRCYFILFGAGTIGQSAGFASLGVLTLIVATMPPDMIMSCHSMVGGGLAVA